MDVIDEKPKMIYKNEINGKPKYQIGLSRKKEDGTYENGYMLARFRKGIELDNQTKIKIKNAWLDFLKIEKRTIPYIFINDFEKVESKEEVKQQKSVDNWDAGKNVEIDDDMLPFYN